MMLLLLAGNFLGWLLFSNFLGNYCNFWSGQLSAIAPCLTRLARKSPWKDTVARGHAPVPTRQKFFHVKLDTHDFVLLINRGGTGAGADLLHYSSPCEPVQPWLLLKTAKNNCISTFEPPRLYGLGRRTTVYSSCVDRSQSEKRPDRPERDPTRLKFQSKLFESSGREPHPAREL